MHENNAGYRLSCRTCANKGVDVGYEGKTGCSARIRAMDHKSSFIQKRKCFLQTQAAFTRQDNEAVRICDRSNNKNKEKYACAEGGMLTYP